MSYRRIASIQTAEDFRNYLAEIKADIKFDEQLQSGPDAPLAQPITLAGGCKVGNRFCILPMEGWDGTVDGRPSNTTVRRWQNFGRSGAKLIWGGEAVAIREDGRANPNQLMISEKNLKSLAALRKKLMDTHRECFGRHDDLYVGLQLTHSGRFACPHRNDLAEPLILYHHPLLDRKYRLQPEVEPIPDNEIERLISDFVNAARLAQRAGFAFVDIKHCHGYLGHEFLSAVRRKGSYGGNFENRTRFLRAATAGIRSEAPGLEIGVRLSAFDFIPFRAGQDGVGEPEASGDLRYDCAFGGATTGLEIDLTEPKKFLELLSELEIELVCITAGSPYYNAHIQRPALFPPSDGYLPPEDPLVGVARQIEVTAKLKQHQPQLIVVGSAYSYLQEWLPNVAQHTVRTGRADFVGLGRMVLSYPELPAHVLEGRTLQKKRLCRTFSDCTSAPRNGLISGCYPLDDYYKKLPQAAELKRLKPSTSSR